MLTANESRSLLTHFLSVCIDALCARNSLPGHKHVWLMLQHKCNCNNHDILSCLIYKTSVILLQQHTQQDVSFFYSRGYNMSSFLPAGSDLNAIVHNCVYILHVNSLSLMQHAPLHITHQHHLSIQQGHSAHTWMHAGINCVGSKYFRLVSARFVCYQPFSHIPSNL